ncbi:MAG: MJ1255/VC2487 family glycosyltransferase [Myxococcota bacterium]
MKILYGVTGEGMGHAIRSRVVLEHLIQNEGHEVEIIASNRAATFLRAHFPEVHTIHGLHIVTEENRVRRGKTLWSNVREGLKNLPGQIDRYFDLIEDFQPQAVISDFESFSYLYAKAHDLPIVSIDNQQVMSRCEVPAEVISDDRADFEVVKAFVKAKLPFCDQYLVATFMRPPIRKKRTKLFPPILRNIITSAKPVEGEHLLVYQTTQENSDLLDALRQSGRECRIYGMRRELIEDEVEGNLRFRPFSETTFVEDLRTSRAVVASAGFTLMGECIALSKPLLAVPLAGQFEQVFNARYLAHEGYGATADAVDTATLTAFLSSTTRYRDALATFTHDGNRALLAALDETLDQAAAGLL